MIKNNCLLVILSIYLIKQFWQKDFGQKYNKKHKILCRFYPSCSDYAIRTLEKYGFFHGWFFAYRRVRKCNKENTKSCVDYP